MYKSIRSMLFLSLAIFLIFTSGCTRYTGIIAEPNGDKVLLIDLDDNSIIGVVDIPEVENFYLHPAVIMSPLGTQGWVAKGNRVFSININDSGAHLDEDSRVLSQDNINNIAVLPNLYLVAGHGNTISIVNPTTMNQTSDEILGAEVASIGVCDDGVTILAATANPNQIIKLQMDNVGNLNSTGHSLPLDFRTASIACAPGSRAGAVLAIAAQTDNLVSFEMAANGLVLKNDVETRDGVKGHTLVFSPEGTKLFTRTSVNGIPHIGYLDRFTFDPDSGGLTEQPDNVNFSATYLNSTGKPGQSTMSVHPDENKLYVAEERIDDNQRHGRINVFNIATGNIEHTFTHPDFPSPYLIHTNGAAKRQ